MEEDKLLLIWVKEKQLAGVGISQTIIREKGKQLHCDRKNTPGMSADTRDAFKVSREWFEKFRKRSGIQCVV